VERLSRRIGLERLAQRDEEVARFLALGLVERLDGAPEGVTPPADEQVAVVMADAGMLQLREPDGKAAAAKAGDPAPAEEADADGDDPDQQKPPPGRHWHEDKVGLVLTMRSPVCRADPCPEVPPRSWTPTASPPSSAG
jgi:hypothetical protein